MVCTTSFLYDVKFYFKYLSFVNISFFFRGLRYLSYKTIALAKYWDEELRTIAA